MANRVSVIQDLTKPNDWYHVCTTENPADLISRGMPPQQLENNAIWLKGPPFLNNNTTYPNKKQCLDDVDIPGREKTFKYIERFSLLSRLQRAMAWIY